MPIMDKEEKNKLRKFASKFMTDEYIKKLNEQISHSGKKYGINYDDYQMLQTSP